LVKRNWNRQILLIDDSETIREVISQQIQRAFPSFSVRTAEDGQSGLDLARMLQPDIILLDLLMPHLDGYAVLEQLKTDPATRLIPTAILTGQGDDHVKADVFQLGALAYISKPVDPMALKASLSSLMQIRENYEDLQEKLAEFRRFVSRLVGRLEKLLNPGTVKRLMI